MSNSERLTPTQLCDLLNYVLGLPQMLGTRTVIRPALHPCVVGTWHTKQVRKRAEAWCDARLAEAGISGAQPARKLPGRPHGASMPREMQHWLPTQLRRAA